MQYMCDLFVCHDLIICLNPRHRSCYYDKPSNEPCEVRRLDDLTDHSSDSDVDLGGVGWRSATVRM